MDIGDEDDTVTKETRLNTSRNKVIEFTESMGRPDVELIDLMESENADSTSVKSIQEASVKSITNEEDE